MKVLKILKGLLKGELFVDRIKAKEVVTRKLKAGRHTVDIENTYIHISGATPYVRFEGTETGAADKGFKEDSGTLKIYDFSAASNVMDIEAHASRHAHGGADALADNALRFSQIDKVFGTESTVTVTAGSTSTISKGVFLVSLGANTKVEYSPDGGTTWRTLIPAGEGGLVISDGSNVRLNNTGTSDETSYLLPVQ